MLLRCIMGVIGSTVLGNLPYTRDYKSDVSSLWVPQLYESAIYELL